MKTRRFLLLLSLAGMLSFGIPAINVNAEWTQTANGIMYTQKASPGYMTGWAKIGDYTYYFNSDGIMQTGFQTIQKQQFYFNEQGQLMTGRFVASNGKTYYGAVSANGALVKNRWVSKRYYLSDGSMAVNTWINGKWVGADGRYTGQKSSVGWITSGGKTYYYDKSGKKVTGWLVLSGNSYYFDPSTGVMKTGWFRVGKEKYYAKKTTGIVQKNRWIHKRYVQSDGSLATGWVDIGKKSYIFSSSGSRKNGWTLYNNVYYYCADGLVKKNAWVSDRKQYVTETGAAATGWLKIGKYTYYFDPSSAIMQTGYLKLSTGRYYLGSNGKLRTSRWIGSAKKYYASETGAFLTGLQTVGGNLYYFNTSSGRKAVNKFKTIGSDTYYFTKDGSAAKNVWIKHSSKYYYLQSDGKLAKNQWVGNYYVDMDGVRTDQTKKTGWQTIDGKKYYYTSEGSMVTGWKTISGLTYYFGTDGAMATGIQTIGSKKHYFYSDGQMAVSVTIAVGAKQYTINSSGVITAEESIKISGNTLGTQIVNFALQYVGNPYVYGGVSLTKGADCSGFVQTVFSNFDIKLLRVADDQMKGPSEANITNHGYKKAVIVDVSSMQPGDLIFYGSGNYASHVAIYMGNGQIVHASNSQPYPKGGIKISDYDYQTPIRVVRYWS